MESNAALNPEAWTQAEAKPVSTEELDALIMEYREKRNKHDAAKAVATDLYNEYKELEGKVIETLSRAGKRKYHVDGIGLCYFIEKLVVRTPKTLEDKKKFFAWLHGLYGETFLIDKQSVNHQSLQKIYNDAYKQANEDGKGAEFQVPGLESPTNEISLGFRSEKGD